jgi:4'-phosphopantetheinyl transferase
MPVLLANPGCWPSDIALWRVDVDLKGQTPGFDRFLNADECDRMARYKRIGDQVRFAAARSSLREILGERVARDPAELEFEVGAYGRPRLAGFPHVSFNVSHSGERVLIAVSGLRAVGVDIEEVNPALDWRALLDTVCAKEEASQMLSVRDFYRCWTAKEALLKATGAGIGVGDGLKSIDLANARIPPGFNFVSLDDFDGYVSAVAFGVHADTSAL